MATSLLLLLDPSLSSSSRMSPPSKEPSSPSMSPLSPLSPEATRFLYSSLQRVDHLVRRYQILRTESNSQANLLAHLSTRLSLLANSHMASTSTRMIDYDNILCPFPKLTLADRMAISLKDDLDRVMIEIDNTLTEMELLYMNVDDILMALFGLETSLGMENGELTRGIKHIQQVYFTLLSEVRGIILLCISQVDLKARRDLWYRFTADEKRKSFLAASTLGDILVTPPVEWEAFAKDWVSIGELDNGPGDEVDELADAMGNWGKQADTGVMMD